jgi:hypothetical protein
VQVQYALLLALLLLNNAFADGGDTKMYLATEGN